MKFAELDKKMRAFELSMDQKIIPETYIVVRLDGRGFTKLTKEVLSLQRPFDEVFRDAMIETVKHLMNCGFNITYGYTESDEISLLLDTDENSFDRKVRKLTSILAGEASAKFTQSMGTIGVFDCRVIPLPNVDLVVDYFRWRAEDASRNALNAWCYWKLRDNGLSVFEATKLLQGKSVSEKNELLFQFGINYNDLPDWQKRGIGFYYEKVDKNAFNLKTNASITVARRQLKVDMELAIGTNYNLLIKSNARIREQIEV
jgi:tRNA(His) guanylyltransferase